MKKLTVYCFISLSLFTVLLSLVGYLGRFHIYLELLTNFKLQYFLLSLIPPFFLALTRRYRWFAVALLCVLLHLSSIAPWYFPSAQISSANSSQSLRLFLFNVLNKNTQYAETIALVRKQQPDIAVFLESTSPWSEKLQALQTDFPYHFSAEKLEIEIYSKLELKNPAIEIYGDFRGWVSSQVRFNDREFLFVAAHTYPPIFLGRQGWRWRNQQLEAMGSYLQATATPIVVVGDLNATMWSVYYRTMIQLSGLHNTRYGFGILPTQSIVSPKIPWLSIPIDHSLVSKDIKVKNVKTAAYLGSDHLPLITDLVFDE